MCAQIELVDKNVALAVADDERVQRLTTVPSVGPVTAVTLIALVDDIARFESADKLQSYLGLVPREYSSGEKQQRGHITKTKTGNRRMRSLLVECAWGILRRQNPSSELLGNWAVRIAARRGKRIAAVAIARKLAGILFAMTKHARAFEPDRLKLAAPPASRRLTSAIPTLTATKDPAHNANPSASKRGGTRPEVECGVVPG
ncbi:MAG: hypothetical protein RLZZ450_4490 [Pseudomonadota bacterium]